MYVAVMTASPQKGARTWASISMHLARDTIDCIIRFGSSAYVYMPKEIRTSKLGPRSRPAMFLGYVHTNIWRLYDMETNRITEATNVIFIEDENAWHRWSKYGLDDYLNSPFDNIEEDVFPPHLDSGDAFHL